MSSKSLDTIDFYKQLSLLVDSNLPLPDAIIQLGQNFNNREFREMLLSIGEETANGRQLSEAMKDYQQYFPPIQIRMIESGEKCGNLSQVLSEVAYMSNLNHQLLQMVKEIALYPTFTIIFAFVIIGFILGVLIPEFKLIFQEMLGGEPLPALTEMVMQTSDWFVNNMHVLIALLIGVVIFFLWLFSGRRGSQRIFNRIIRILPLSGSIFTGLNMGRICTFLSTLLKQKITLPESMIIIADLIDNASLRFSLKRIAENCTAGRSLDEALEQEGLRFNMIRLTVKHVPEERLPDELANLAILYRQRSASSIKKAEIFWEISLIIFLSILVSGVVLSIFAPMITIIKRLGGS